MERYLQTYKVKINTLLYQGKNNSEHESCLIYKKIYNIKALAAISP